MLWSKYHNIKLDNILFYINKYLLLFSFDIVTKLFYNRFIFKQRALVNLAGIRGQASDRRHRLTN